MNGKLASIAIAVALMIAPTAGIQALACDAGQGQDCCCSQDQCNCSIPKSPDSQMSSPCGRTATLPATVAYHPDRDSSSSTFFAPASSERVEVNSTESRPRVPADRLPPGLCDVPLHTLHAAFLI